MTTQTTPAMQATFLPQHKTLAERPLRDWPPQQRPTERLFEVGPVALSDIELLALLIGSQARPNPITIAGELLVAAGGTWLAIQRLTIEQIAAHAGISRDAAARIKAAIEVGRRLMLNMIDERPQIRSPADAAQLLMLEMASLDQEQLRVILLDTKNRVQRIHTVYMGSLNSSMVRVGEVYKEAIRMNSAALIVVHNHPSGEPTPSPEDILVTRQIVEAGKLLDIECVDHLVIGQGRFVSMRERGLGFEK